MKGLETRLRLSTLICAAIGISCFYLLSLARSGFAIEDYPWMFPDSFDWIANGLRYGLDGATFNISHRAMLLPLVVATGVRFDSLDQVALFGSCFYLIGAAVIYIGLGGICSKFVRISTTYLYLFSPLVLGQSAFIGSDVAANVLLTGTALWFLRYQLSRKSKYLLVSALFCAVGVHTQYINLIFLPTLLLMLVFDDKCKLNFGTAKALLKNPWAYASLLLAATVVIAFLLPRLLEFEMLYEEKVQHGSLVRLYWNGWPYYLAGSLAAFSWPVLGAAMLSVRCLWSKNKTRLTWIYFITWIAVVAGFFAALYTWRDTRFLLYVSTPIFVLAMMGVEALITNKAICWFVGISIALFSHLTPSTDPFDFSFALSPWHSASINERFELKSITSPVQPYFLSHWSDSRTARETLVADDNYDSISNSKPFRKLVSSLRARGENLRDLVLYFKLSPAENYIFNNRNVIYFGDRLRRLEDVPSLIKALEENNLAIVTTVRLRNELQRNYDLVPVSVIASEGRYLVARYSQLEPGEFERRIKLPDNVAEVKAEESPNFLMDGITNSVYNWSASELNNPIIVNFIEPVQYTELKLHLFDFDQRSYAFQVSVVLENGESLVVATVEKPGVSGVFSVKLPNQNIRAVKITGQYNSNMIQNPGNTSIHIKELEFKE